MPHVSAVITNLAQELTLVDRMQDALSGEMVRRGSCSRRRQLRLDPRLREGPRQRRGRSSRCRRCSSWSTSSPRCCRPSRVHRPLRRHRPPRPLARPAPAARLAAARGGPAARPGVPPVLPRRPAHLLGRRVTRPCSACPTPTSCRPFPAWVSSSPTSRRCCASRRRTSPGRRPRHAAYAATRAATPRGIRRSRSRRCRRSSRTRRRGARARRRAPQGERASLLDIAVDRMEGHGPAAHQVWLPPLDVPDTLDELMPDLVEDPEPAWSRRVAPGSAGW